MWNLGGGEVMVILLLALIVLGPQKLPEAARQVGRFSSEIKRMSNGFRSEVKAAFEAAEEADARAKGDALVAEDDKGEDKGEEAAPAAPDEPDEPEDDQRADGP